MTASSSSYPAVAAVTRVGALPPDICICNCSLLHDVLKACNDDGNRSDIYRSRIEKRKFNTASVLGNSCDKMDVIGSCGTADDDKDVDADADVICKTDCVANNGLKTDTNVLMVFISALRCFLLLVVCIMA